MFFIGSESTIRGFSPTSRPKYSTPARMSPYRAGVLFGLDKGGYTPSKEVAMPAKEISVSFKPADWRRIQKAARFSKNKWIRGLSRTKRPYP